MTDARNATAWLPPRQFLPGQATSSHPPVAYRMARLPVPLVRRHRTRNGAGKTTLLRLAPELLAPTAGTIEVLGGPPAADPAQLGWVGFVAQDTPTYARLSVADHLRLGAKMNPGWDNDVAQERIARPT